MELLEDQQFQCKLKAIVKDLVYNTNNESLNDENQSGRNIVTSDTNLQILSDECLIEGWPPSIETIQSSLLRSGQLQAPEACNSGQNEAPKSFTETVFVKVPDSGYTIPLIIQSDDIYNSKCIENNINEKANDGVIEQQYIPPVTNVCTKSQPQIVSNSNNYENGFQKEKTPPKSKTIIDEINKKSLSTPRRRTSHVRTLNFNTPFTAENANREIPSVSVNTSADNQYITPSTKVQSSESQESLLMSAPPKLSDQQKKKYKNKSATRSASKRTQEKENTSSVDTKNTGLEEWCKMRLINKNDWDNHLRKIQETENTNTKETKKKPSRKKSKRTKSSSGNSSETAKAQEQSKLKIRIRPGKSDQFKIDTDKEQINPATESPPFNSENVLESLNLRKVETTKIQQTTTPIVKEKLSTMVQKTNVEFTHTEDNRMLSTMELAISNTGVSTTHHTSLLPETPFKLDGNMPLLNTPCPKVVNRDDALYSLIKHIEFPTPNFPITPGTLNTPNIEIISKELMNEGYQSRATDYSSSSSYYKPDELDNAQIELLLAGDKDKNKNNSQELENETLTGTPIHDVNYDAQSIKECSVILRRLTPEEVKELSRPPIDTSNSNNPPRVIDFDQTNDLSNSISMTDIQNEQNHPIASSTSDKNETFKFSTSSINNDQIPPVNIKLRKAHTRKESTLQNELKEKMDLIKKGVETNLTKPGKTKITKRSEKPSKKKIVAKIQSNENKIAKDIAPLIAPSVTMQDVVAKELNTGEQNIESNEVAQVSIVKNNMPNVCQIENPTLKNQINTNDNSDLESEEDVNVQNFCNIFSYNEFNMKSYYNFTESPNKSSNPKNQNPEKMQPDDSILSRIQFSELEYMLLTTSNEQLLYESEPTVKSSLIQTNSNKKKCENSKKGKKTKTPIPQVFTDDSSSEPPASKYPKIRFPFKVRYQSKDEKQGEKNCSPSKTTESKR